MEDIWKVYEINRLQEEIKQAEKTLAEINCQKEFLLDKGARAISLRVLNFYKAINKGGLSPELKAELIRQKNELYDDPVYSEYRRYDRPSTEAYKKLFAAKDALEQLLAEGTPPSAPPAAIASLPSPSGNAESKFSLLPYCSNFTNARIFCTSIGSYSIYFHKFTLGIAGGTDSSSVSGAAQFLTRLTEIFSLRGVNKGIQLHDAHLQDKEKDV